MEEGLDGGPAGGDGAYLACMLPAERELPGGVSPGAQG